MRGSLYKCQLFLSLFKAETGKYLQNFHSSAALLLRKSEMGKSGKKKAAVSQKKTAGHKIPSNVHLVVIGTGGPGTSRCLLLTTEFSRYMFNCGEGSQRLTVMNKCLKSTANAKISGLDNIFITHKNWVNTGGLLGIAMLVEGQKNPEIRNYMSREKKDADVNDVKPKESQNALPELTLYGPQGIEQVTMMARKFAEKSNMNIVRKEGVFEDTAFRITPIVLKEDSSTSHPGLKDDDNGDQDKPGKDLLRSTPLETDIEETYAYICSAHPLPAKINVEKCVDAGITLGPMVGELQRGNPVTLPDGTVVHPHQVTDKPENVKNSFIVVECPSQNHICLLRDEHRLSQYTGPDRKESVAIVVHATPPHVFSSQPYQDWLSSFGEDTDHLVMNGDSQPADLSRVRTHQAHLNLVDPEVFPLMPDFTATPLCLLDGSQRPKVVHACSGLVYTLRGKNSGFHVETDDLDVETLQREVLEIPEVKTELDHLKENIGSEIKNEPSYPKVVFLGTGSSEPNRIRAQSCICVHLNPDTVMILDCGEDSFGQLFRFYGQEEVWKTLLKLKAIFVSHMHGDHHLGLLTLLKERQRAFELHQAPFQPVLLMAPIQMKRWLKFYHNQLEPVLHLFRFFKHQRDLKEFDDQVVMDTATLEDIHSCLNLKEYEAMEVIHARNSFGAVFTHQSGFKLAYSGDTRPCDALIQSGQNCDLLIHEATHQDDLLTHAMASKHSTFSEAMQVGQQMSARHIILTHFSQRYPHMVPFLDTSTVPSNVGVAFDNMQVTPITLTRLNKFISPLTQIFAEKIQRLEVKRMKRTREQAGLEDS